MNRAFLFLLLPLGILFTMTSCGVSVDSAYSARQIAEVILSSQDELPPLSVITPEEDSFDERIENVYLVNAGLLVDGAVYSAQGAEADEIAVFEITDGVAPSEIQSALVEYVAERGETFAGYFPEEAAMIENSSVAVQGDYVALMICEDPADANSAFLACFSENPPALPVTLPVPPAPEEPAAPEAPAKPLPPLSPPYAPAEKGAAPSDGYDHDAILAAWESGDRAGLSEKDLAILDAASKVIGETVRPDMEDHEKELAIHDWIVDWTYYDQETLSNAPDASPDPDNQNPYGLLINKQAICEGYSSTFQLFMDMIGIECVIVEGFGSGDEPHAWNMVRLSDGEWYCVDVTWDDASDTPESEGARVSHAFFNATSEYLRDTRHEWDEEGVPEAASDAYMWN